MHLFKISISKLLAVYAGLMTDLIDPFENYTALKAFYSLQGK